MKIALLGQFGSGNSGNDGSLDAMISILKSRIPEAELHCICANPEVVGARHHIRASWHGRAILRQPLARRLNRLFGDLPRNILSVLTMIGTLKGTRWLIVPGTGIFDDFQESAFGWPFVVFRWSLIARLIGAKVAFISVGAGPLNHALGRWFTRIAIRMAAYRTYRDEYSRDFLKTLGVNVKEDLVFPDIAFNLSPPADRRPKDTTPKIVGVGVMNYRGWSRDAPDGGLIYNTYLDKLVRFIAWLTDNGHQVRLLTGDVGDKQAISDLLERLRALNEDSNLNSDNILFELTEDLQGLMNQIANTDLVVASRYHNIVCSLKLNRPVISIGYNSKNEYLLYEFGQSDFCQRIETLDSELLKYQFGRLLENAHEIQSNIRKQNAVFADLLNIQIDLLLKRIIIQSSYQSEPLQM